MAEYVLTEGAESDLRDILRYTRKTWSRAQAARYGDRLRRHFEGLSRDEVWTRSPFDEWPHVRFSKCTSHIVVSCADSAGQVVILAVLHSRMEIFSRLRDRLGERP